MLGLGTAGCVIGTLFVLLVATLAAAILSEVLEKKAREKYFVRTIRRRAPIRRSRFAPAFAAARGAARRKRYSSVPTASRVASTTKWKSEAIGTAVGAGLLGLFELFHWWLDVSRGELVFVLFLTAYGGYVVFLGTELKDLSRILVGLAFLGTVWLIEIHSHAIQESLDMGWLGMWLMVLVLFGMTYNAIGLGLWQGKAIEGAVSEGYGLK